MITTNPTTIYADSTGALVLLDALPNRAVTWALTGAGTLRPLSLATDAQGRAVAVFVPGGAGAVRIQASYGA